MEGWEGDPERQGCGVMVEAPTLGWGDKKELSFLSIFLKSYVLIFQEAQNGGRVCKNSEKP